jgi:hypothetical protein
MPKELRKSPVAVSFEKSSNSNQAFCGSHTSPHTSIPISLSIFCITLPIPGTLRTLSVVMKSTQASRVFSSAFWPSGLLASEQILATIRLGAIPALAVNRVRVNIWARISHATIAPVIVTPTAQGLVVIMVGTVAAITVVVVVVVVAVVAVSAIAGVLMSLVLL